MGFDFPNVRWSKSNSNSYLKLSYQNNFFLKDLQNGCKICEFWLFLKLIRPRYMTCSPMCPQAIRLCSTVCCISSLMVHDSVSANDWFLSEMSILSWENEEFIFCNHLHQQKNSKAHLVRFLLIVYRRSDKWTDNVERFLPPFSFP